MSEYDAGNTTSQMKYRSVEDLEERVVAVEGQQKEQRREWIQSSQWATAVNVAVFTVVITLSVGLVSIGMLLGDDLGEKGERLAVIEERLRQITVQNSMAGSPD